jgi:hypothetical protein
MIFNLFCFLIIEIEDQSNKNEKNCFRNIRLFVFFFLFALCHHIYIHFKLVLSLFNRREATLSLSLSMLANDEKKKNQKRKNIRAPFLLFYCLLLINNPPFFFFSQHRIEKRQEPYGVYFCKFRHDFRMF